MLTVDRSWMPNNVVEPSPNCPRCDSPNTKFCYYNNYSLSQPRYFCKGCRRYWTEGGALRKVPVGGGCRKKRRPKSLRHTSTNLQTNQPHNSLRPDLVLDGIAFRNQTSSPNSDLLAAEATSIDLAELYAKYLNPTAENNNFAECQKLSEPTAPETLAANQVDFSVDELEFTMDARSSGYHQLLSVPLADRVGEYFGSELAWPGSSTEAFGTDQSMLQNGGLISYENIASSSDWNSYDPSSFEAMYPA